MPTDKQIEAALASYEIHTDYGRWLYSDIYFTHYIAREENQELTVKECMDRYYSEVSKVHRDAIIAALLAAEQAA